MFARIAATGLAALAASCAQAPASVTSDVPAGTQWASQCEDWDEWDKPAPAFLLHGSTYHVGTCGISALLIADQEGHILIDTGTQGGAGIVLDNIRALGFDPADIATLLMSHEHFDHVGGVALIQAQTDARFLVSPASQEVLRTGEADPRDQQFGLLDAMSPARVDGLVEDGETVTSGSASLTAHATPGHTFGALSWQWESCDEDGNCKSIVYADSLSPISNDEYRFSDHPDYVQDYRDGLASLAALDCDILLTPHPSASGMRDKLLAGDLTSGTNCADYAASITARLDARLAEEAEGTP